MKYIRYRGLTRYDYITANDDEVPMTLPLDANDKNDKKSGKICWGGSIEGIDCGEQVAAWLSWNLDRPGLRLIKCTGRNPPEINKYGKVNYYKIIMGSD